MNPESSSKTLVHVAVAVIVNDRQQVLLTLRPDHVHQGGLWEFPGGKIEAEESPVEALRREVREELGIAIGHCSPLIRILHHYPDKSVFLDVMSVEDFAGEPLGQQGQPMQWCDIDGLDTLDFPQANRGIIRALQLPQRYLITGSFSNENDFERRLLGALKKDIKLVQLRIPSVSDEEYLYFAGLAQDLCLQYSARLMLNTSAELFAQVNADGLHLNSTRLFEYQHRPVPDQYLLSASCHNEQQLQQAAKLGVDLLLVSPVKETRSHPGVAGLGWNRFEQLVNQANVPVYALGGMQEQDLARARQAGAQGIAAISSYW